MKVISSISHEFKTPLNCSINMLELLYENKLLSSNLINNFLEPALNCNYLLLSQINDVIDYALIESKKFTLID